MVQDALSNVVHFLLRLKARCRQALQEWQSQPAGERRRDYAGGSGGKEERTSKDPWRGSGLTGGVV